MGACFSRSKHAVLDDGRVGASHDTPHTPGPSHAIPNLAIIPGLVIACASLSRSSSLGSTRSLCWMWSARSRWIFRPSPRTAGTWPAACAASAWAPRSSAPTETAAPRTTPSARGWQVWAPAGCVRGVAPAHDWGGSEPGHAVLQPSNGSSMSCPAMAISLVSPQAT